MKNFRDWLFVTEAMITPATLPSKTIIYAKNNVDNVVFEIIGPNKNNEFLNAKFAQELERTVNINSFKDIDFKNGVVNIMRSGRKQPVKIGKLISEYPYLLKIWETIRSGERLGFLEMFQHKTDKGIFWTPHNNSKQGYGPFLYDIAIEYGTQHGDGVVPAEGMNALDRNGGFNSKDSRAVWKYYYEKRHDVKHVSLNIENKIAIEEPYLYQIYTKQPIFIQELERSGKLKWK